MSDHERPLNDRGARNGEAMQEWYSHHTHPAEWIWCSSARRARQTAKYVSRGFDAQIVEEPELYLASAEVLLGCLQMTPPHVSSVAIVAHNPGLTHLVNLLGHKPITDNLVTFGSALFGTHTDWPSLHFGCAKLVSLQTPKSI
jgi:phosphohistidine phosphatase